MRISLYDKTREQLGHNGNVVRVEVQLKGKLLKELLGNGERVTKLDIATCYQAYRSILLGFVPSPVAKVGTIAELLAIGERERWSSSGVPAFNIYTHNRSPRQVIRIRRDMAAYRPSVFNIDWTQLLPADGPPMPVEVAGVKGDKGYSRYL
jgi:hypothetical protein